MYVPNPLEADLKLMFCNNGHLFIPGQDSTFASSASNSGQGKGRNRINLGKRRLMKNEKRKWSKNTSKVTCISQEDRLKLKLEELRIQLDKEWQRNTTLDNKAAAIIQIAGIITTLIFGFVTFTQSIGADAKFTITPVVQLLIILSIVFGIISIVLCIGVTFVRKYSYSEQIERYFLNPEDKFDADDAERYQFYDEVLDEKRTYCINE
jgi:hypothetical protein